MTSTNLTCTVVLYDAMHKRASVVVRWLADCCLSVRLSVTFVYSNKTNKHIPKLLYPPVVPPF